MDPEYEKQIVEAFLEVSAQLARLVEVLDVRLQDLRLAGATVGR